MCLADKLYYHLTFLSFRSTTAIARSAGQRNTEHHNTTQQGDRNAGAGNLAVGKYLQILLCKVEMSWMLRVLLLYLAPSNPRRRRPSASRTEEQTDLWNFQPLIYWPSSFSGCHSFFFHVQLACSSQQWYIGHRIYHYVDNRRMPGKFYS